ncbi:MAG TPA: FliH/SctL family protein [Candidatus Acidoferrales bacterium]|jgi:flagellar biosynthesis/type III secretory pathway protein FliH|nr:FliH/SctL family protein [Candidatus Acidoferrales bacterium]
MHDAFVPLAEYLRVPVAPVVLGEVEICDEPVAEMLPQQDEVAVDEALAELRRFRAALADALDLRVEMLLAGIAASVLARELRLAPADVRAVVARELALSGESPIRIRAHPSECESLSGWDAAVVADPSLRRGDVSIDLQSGTIAATLGCRLERAIVAAASV